MSAQVLTAEAAKAANIQLVEGPKGDQAVHDLVVAYRNNRRTGSACTKTRGEVRGSGRKIYKQKGTGNARHGDRRAPIFVGGGVVFGPRPRDYSQNVPKAVRKLALRRVLNDRIAEGSVLTVSDFAVADGKTKSFISAVGALTEAKKVLVIAPSFDEATYRAGRNVQNVLLMTAAQVNVEELLHADTVVIVEGAFETLATRTA